MSTDWISAVADKKMSIQFVIVLVFVNYVLLGYCLVLVREKKAVGDNEGFPDPISTRITDIRSTSHHKNGN